MRLAVVNARRVPRDAIPLASCKEGILVAIDDDEEGDQAIELPEGDSFQVLPETREDLPQHVHIVGPSGVGKSTWAGEFADVFRRDKGGRVVVVSKTAADDPAIDADSRVGVGPELADVDLEEIVGEEPLLLIFDDVEGLVDKESERALMEFRKAALERGRKMGISTLNIYHRGASGKATRDSLSEATGVVLFPRGGISSNTAYMLKNHFGIPPSFLALIRKSPAWGRAVFISNSYPPAAIGDRRAALLDSFEVELASKAQRQEMRARAAHTVAQKLRGKK